ncbi:MAG: YggS family pyridoxal phosphate-dependent enzyme [Planctomycetaceae bacterium]
MTSSPPLLAQLTTNLGRVWQRMQDACLRAGRSGDSVRLVAVTKTASVDSIRAFLAVLGTEPSAPADLGENRPQQLASRARELPDSIRWHLIGHLQRNKVDLAVAHAALVHSVDSERLLQALNAEAGKAGRRLPILLEVNVAGEAQKHGFAPTELETRFEQLASQPHLEIQGLMTMAPFADDPELARPTFRGLRNLRDRLAARSLPGLTLPHLSMGMSGDFEVAIEEGATLVRVGSALWENVPPSS